MGLEEIRRLKDEAGQPKQKKIYRIPKQSAKKKAQIAAEREARGGDDTELQKWFKARMKVMSRNCNECGAVVEHHVYKYAINSICHILAKRDGVCPSVKYHPLNFITLCPYHHDKFDKSNWDEIEQWGAWPLIKYRLISVWEDLAPNERRHFPPKLREWIEANNPFTDK